MNRILAFCSIAFFSIFIGTQVAEGALLVPHWKSMSSDEFYEYYAQFGPMIARFYTILTIAAALIPVLVGGYCFYKKSAALSYSLVSIFLSVAFIAFFYIYFKGTNQQFYEAAFGPEQLQAELIIWGYWHWTRVLIEFLALLFLILSLQILTKEASH
ncbi:MAG: hypothetical protein AAFV95_16250 [Bacteroidota bacterium]